MAKDSNLRTQYTTKARKDEISGQICLDISPGDKKPKYVEKRKYKCSIHYARTYWFALSFFLDMCGELGKVLHLKEQVKKDEEYTPEKLAELSYELQRQIKESIKYHKHIMRTYYRCHNSGGLEYNESVKRQSAMKALTELIIAAENANVGLGIKKNNRGEFNRNELNEIINRFTLLDSYNDGACRREFYRKRFIKNAMSGYDKGSVLSTYVDPVSMKYIDQKFAEDEEFKAAFRKRQDKKKNYDHAHQEERMQKDGAKSTTPG